ncbi:ABC transporter ATP-binding protein, partial [Candidatus Sumerlaeota bacterium]|nr:ABC transporter ATP-binding protein [Candidatus Sumerlaeota bacterium]
MHNSDFQKLDHPVRTFFRFLKFLLPYWDKVLFIILGIMIAAPMGNIHMVISKAIIDQVVLNQNESIKRRLFMLFFFMSLAAVITWSGQLLERLRGFMGFYLRMFVTLDLRRKFYSHLHRLPFKFFQGRPIGEHMYRCMNDISSEVWTSRGIVDMITANAPDIFRILNDMFWQGMIVFFLNPMAAFFIGVTIIPYTILSYWMNTWIKRAFFRLKREEQAVPAVLRDTIAGVETVKSYGRRRYMNNRYVRQLISSIRATMRRDYLQVALDQFVFWALDLIAVGGLWTYLARQLMIGEITVGSFYVLLNISVRFIGPFKQMINQYMTIR